jgi:D-alanyl-D-alanine carboxypeptidase (penicillin-binding protein 5/6)
MLVYSANDATVVLAEHVGGSEEKFAEMMNRKAVTLGMKNTHYCNATGLDMRLYPSPPLCNGEHVMSAEDSSILATRLLKEHPKVIEFTSMKSYTFHKGTSRERTVTNWNKMLKGFKYEYEGVDGAKTGHTNAAGYCFTGSAKRDNFRLISVVMGTANDDKRFTETKKLLDYGFQNFQLREILKKGTAIPGKEKIAILEGVEREIPVSVKEDIVIPVQSGKEKSYTLKITPKPNLKAPLKKDDVVGKVEVLFDGKPIEGLKPFDLVAAQSMEKGSWFRLFFRGVGDRIGSWF